MDYIVETINHVLKDSRQERPLGGREGAMTGTEQQQQQQPPFPTLVVIPTYVIGKERILLAVRAWLHG